MTEGTRRFPRIASHHSVLVKSVGDDAVEQFVRTRTIAVGGCSFITDQTFGVGALIDLLIAIEHRVITATARVVYERPIEGMRKEIGVQFLKITDEDAEAITKLFESVPSPEMNL